MNPIIDIDDQLFGCFYNYEYEKTGKTKVIDYYPCTMDVPISVVKGDYDLMINDDIDAYLRDYLLIQKKRPVSITVRKSNTELSKRLELSLIAYCQREKINLLHYHETMGTNSPRMNALANIAKNVICIPNFESFRNIKFYKDPDISNEVVEVSQAQIITDIIEQAERAYDTSTGNNYRDIFITAFTGAGKSVMFQVPAVYLAQKHKKLTIIIEPVKSLMQDQKDQLNERGYKRVEVFNSDLITQTEKEMVLQKVKNGEVDLLYLSPETLLSYSMETIIGDREIGLIIVDEAHIVTTWGVGFRPDYWYLGGYINRIRHAVQITRKHYQSRVQHFPICAFTATAVHSGMDDSVSDTIISLYMENPIKYIGYIKRDDIHFQIENKNETKLSNNTYEEYKARTFSIRVREWLRSGKKTVVYFPYASYAGHALHGTKSFADVMPTGEPRIGIYTGRNLDSTLSREAQTALKKETFKKFKNGDITVMYATKAFGMGVDIDDIENVYHYAVTGNLSDYVQEIGRAARRKGMTGTAITDYYYNDISFMQRLFGMSQIRQFQVQRVLSGIYDVYLAKKESRNFLISPEAFAYIFAGKNSDGKLESCINQLKTCLLMLEKDLFDKFSFKVLISRPQSVFTKAYVVIQEENKERVLNSQYGHCFQFVEKGRIKEDSPHGWKVTDQGDISDPYSQAKHGMYYYRDLFEPSIRNMTDRLPFMVAVWFPGAKIDESTQLPSNYKEIEYAILDSEDLEAVSKKPLDKVLKNIYPEQFEYDDIIIDEAQDLEDAEVMHLKMIAELKDGHFFAFYDKNQIVLKREYPKWIDKSECKLVLTRNCRNTYEIACTAYNVIDAEVKQKLNAITGVKPSICFADSDNDAIDRLQKLISYYMNQENGYNENEITILSLTSEEKSFLNNREKIGQYSFVRKRDGKHIFVTTAKKFKGLEGKVIIIIDINRTSFDDDQQKRAFYVACSRATHRLSLFINADEEKMKEIAGAIPGKGYKDQAKIVMKTKTKKWDP